MRTIYIYSGAPGSGKSTRAQESLTKYGGAYCGRDSLRSLIRAELKSDKYFPVSPKEETERWFAFLAEVLTTETHGDIHIDQTTIGHGALEKILGGIRPYLEPRDIVVIRLMKTKLSKCLSRNAARPEDIRVPDKTIMAMHTRSKLEPFSRENLNIIAKAHNLKPGNLVLEEVESE